MTGVQTCALPIYGFLVEKARDTVAHKAAVQFADKWLVLTAVTEKNAGHGFGLLAIDYLKCGSHIVQNRYALIFSSTYQIETREHLALLC